MSKHVIQKSLTPKAKYEYLKSLMSWMAMKNERDENGLLTPLALALDAIEDYGCDCGTDEPGTCMACLCEAALKDQWERLNSYRPDGE